MPSRPASASSRSTNLLVSAAALCLTVGLIGVVGEIALRTMAPQSDEMKLGVWLPDSQRRYALKPNVRSLQTGVEVATNSLGFRDREFPQAKQPGVRRIAVLGDSYALGVGVPFEAVFSRRIEVLLNAKTPGWEVINFGVNGYDTEMELATLREVAAGFAPDLVLVAYVPNDAELRFGVPQEEHTASSAPSLRQRIDAAHLSIKNISLLYRYFAPKIGAALGLVGGRYWTGKTNEIVRDYAPESVGWARSSQALLAIDREAKRMGAATLVVVFPMMVDFQTYPLAPVHETIARFCREHGMSVLDLLPAMHSHDVADLAVFLDGHPNAEAHQIFADAIVAYLLSDHRG